MLMLKIHDGIKEDLENCKIRYIAYFGILDNLCIVSAKCINVVHILM